MKKPSNKSKGIIKNINNKNRVTHGPNLALIKLKNNISLLQNESRLFLPKIISLFKKSERHELTMFLKNLNGSLRHGKKIKINFSNTIELHPCGTILFCASILSLLKKYPNKLSASHYPNNDTVEQMLQHIGILKLLGLTERKTINDKMVVDWNFTYGVEGTFDEKFEATSEYLQSHLNLDDSDLLTGVSEAVDNTQNHAYSDNRSIKPWWLFSTVKDNVLSVAVCDIGIGIASSLPRRLKEELQITVNQFFKTLRLTNSKKESTMIEAALQFQRSRLNSDCVSHRGKGLSQMLSVANEVPKSTFLVHSNKGMYAYRNEDGGDCRKMDYPDSINGTVVLWSVPVGMITNE